MTDKILFRRRMKAAQGQLLLSLYYAFRTLTKFPIFRPVYLKLLLNRIRRTGLFDAEYYRGVNADIAESDLSPLRHYTAYGDREGRSPMPFFDPGYYRAQVKSRLKNVNALLHYSCVGHHLNFSPSPWFEVRFYMAHNKDVARATVDPLLHYLGWGGLEGRSPCPQFDGAHYLRENPDVVAEKINPLIHYLRFGRYEGRTIHPAFIQQDDSSELAFELSKPVMPSVESWGEVSPHAEVKDAAVDVVVPVYMGHSETLRCLYSVLTASCEISFELVVINDASLDPALVKDLERLAESN